jgi:hypothetical protein
MVVPSTGIKAFQRSCSTMGGECGEKLFAIPGLEDVGGWL